MITVHKCSFYFIIGIFLITNISCNKPPQKANAEEVFGLVIGKEICKANPDDDYWLIDCKLYNPNRQKIGDSIVLNGMTYHDVIKVKGLSQQFKVIGKYIGIEYNIINEKTLSTDCSVSNPLTFPLKEIVILTVGEACCAP